MPTFAHPNPNAQLAQLTQTADAAELSAVLNADETSLAQGYAMMRWLRAHRPAVADQTLCLLYGVFWYQVGESCFKDSELPENQDKWFLAVDADSALLDTTTLPLAESAEAACAMAVARLNLETTFFAQ